MIDVHVVGGWAAVGLSGEFDVANAAKISSVVGGLVDQAVTEVTVDLSRVALMGAAGLHALVTAGKAVEAAAGRMVLIGAAGQTRRVFELTGLDAELPFFAVPPGRAPATDAGPIGRCLFELGCELLTAPTVTEDLERVLRAAVEVVPGACDASVSVRAGGRLRTAAVSSAAAVQLDLVRYAAGDGACPRTAQTARHVRIDDVGAAWCHDGAAVGAVVDRVLSVPVGGTTGAIGSLNIYGDQFLTSAAEVSAHVIAAQVAVALRRGEAPAATRCVGPAGAERINGREREDGGALALTAVERCCREQAAHLLDVTEDETLLTATARRIVGLVTGGSLGHGAGPVAGGGTRSGTGAPSLRLRGHSPR